MRRLLGFSLAFLLMAAAPGWAASSVLTVRVEGVISPISDRIVGMALDRAKAEHAQALVMLLDTPGGLERSMRAIVQKMLNAELPVIVYVSPTGARAASAGVFITLAGHVAAMAPATNIGAAHPVAVGGGEIDKESMKKITNDAAAFMRTIALERGRNVDWAEKTVRSSISATEREALKLKAIDLVAENLEDLLAKVDGRKVKTVKGAIVLQTRNAIVKPVDARNARPLLRAGEPRRDPAWGDRRDLADPRLLRVPEPSDQLRGAPPDRVRGRAPDRRDQGGESRGPRHRRHHLNGARLAHAV
jgi:membrane-bound serine protease (ClpP class)